MPAPSPRGPIVISAVVVEGGLAVAAWWLGGWWGYPPQDQLQLNLEGLGWGAVAVLPMLLLMLWVTRSSWRPWRHLSGLVRRQVAPLFADCSYLDLALISALAGLGEEAMFRGVLQPGLASLWGIWPSLLAVSLLFGMAHMMTPAYFLMATLMGAFLGGVMLFTQNLLAPIVAHAMYDFLVLCYLLRLPKRSQAVNSP